MNESDDGTLSEIIILPDGRVYIFGMTLPLLETLAALPTREGHWQALLAQYHPSTSAVPNEEPSRE